MNKLTIIGNLVRDPEIRTTTSGVSVCSFTVAVNRRRAAEAGKPEADFFRVSAWRNLGENCSKYLSKGRKVCVVGPVTVSTYTDKEGKDRFNLEVTAEDVEFLSSKSDAGESAAYPAADPQPAQSPANREAVVQNTDDDELPF